MNELTLYNSKSEELILSDTRKAGGEGRIYAVKGNHFICAKVFYENSIDTELPKKIKAMIRNAPEDPTWSIIGYRSIAWPTEVLYFDSSLEHFAGYTMPYIDTKIFKESHIYYDPADRIREFGGTFTWKYLITAAFNICNAVESVHHKGHCIGDLRENNILVAPNTLVTLVDCDSFQIFDPEENKTYYTRVGTGEFLPPELHAADFKHSDYDRMYSDRFALAVLIFKFLMMGTHPYQAKGKLVEDTPSTEGKILKGLYPYLGNQKGIMPPEYAPDYEIIPPVIKDLFFRSFVEGHKSPPTRPTAREWLEALRLLIESLRECKVNRNHVYSEHLSHCPWCKMKKDYFPQSYIMAQQILLPLPGTKTDLQPFHNAVIWCPACGVSVEFDYSFCSNCGMSVKDMG